MSPGFASGNVRLLDAPKLVAQLAALVRRLARGGRDSINHPVGAHDDLPNAATGALRLILKRPADNSLQVIPW